MQQAVYNATQNTCCRSVPIGDERYQEHRQQGHRTSHRHGKEFQHKKSSGERNRHRCESYLRSAYFFIFFGDSCDQNDQSKNENLQWLNDTKFSGTRFREFLLLLAPVKVGLRNDYT